MNIVSRIRTRPLHAAATALGLCAAISCSDDSNARVTTRSNAPSASAGTPAPLIITPQAGGAGSSSPTMQPTAAGNRAQASTPIAQCAPGTYAGTYDIGLLGMGPITFNLVPSDTTVEGSVPCQEFCPDLVLDAAGGEFDASWLGFLGHAKLTGGLDCRSGEFRGEMVDGKFGFSSDPSNPDAPIDGGDLTGVFVGRFSANTAARIAGDIMFNAGIDMTGKFNVTRSP